MNETPEQRAERIFKEDEEIQKKRKAEDDEGAMIDRHLKRYNAYNEEIQKNKSLFYFMEIYKMKPKTLVKFLLKARSIAFNDKFDTEEAEYQAIGKHGLLGYFNLMNQKLRDEWADFARKMGCFEY